MVAAPLATVTTASTISNTPVVPWFCVGLGSPAPGGPCTISQVTFHVVRSRRRTIRSTRAEPDDVAAIALVTIVDPAHHTCPRTSAYRSAAILICRPELSP